MRIYRLLVYISVSIFVLIFLASAASTAEGTSAKFYVMTNVNGVPYNGIEVHWTYAGGSGSGTSMFVFINDDLLNLHYNGAGGCTFTVPKNSAPVNVSATYMGMTASNITTVCGDSNMVTFEFNVAPPTTDKNFYIFTKVNGNFANRVSITCTSSAGTTSTLTHDMVITDSGISHNGPGGCLFTVHDPHGPVSFSAYYNGHTTSQTLDSYGDINALTFDITDAAINVTPMPTTVAGSPTPIPFTQGPRFNLTLIPLTYFYVNSPPNTTAYINGTMGNNGWFVSPVKVALQAYDVDPGVDKTYYMTTGDPACSTDDWVEYNGAITITNGVYHLYYFSVDKDGNKELVRGPVKISVDTVAPDPKIKNIKDLQEFERGSSVFVEYDTGVQLPIECIQSGFDYEEAYIAPAGEMATKRAKYWLDTSETGDYTYSYYVYDKAGNKGSKSVIYRVVESGLAVSSVIPTPTATPTPTPTPAPTASGAANVINTMVNGFLNFFQVTLPAVFGVYATPVPVSPTPTLVIIPLPSTTPGSGTSGGTGQSKVVELPLPEVQVFNINTSGTAKTVFKPVNQWPMIVLDADNTTITPPKPPLSNGNPQATPDPKWLENNGIIKPLGTPSPGPIQAPKDDVEQWLLDNGFISEAGSGSAGQQPTGPASNDLPHTVMYPTEASQSDANPPHTTVTLSGTAGKNGWYTSPVTFKLKAKDDMSGVKVTYFAIAGDKPCNTNGFKEYNGPVTVTDGSYLLFYYSVDKESNKEQVHGPVAIKVDTLKPELTLIDPNEGAKYPRNYPLQLQYDLIMKPGKGFTQSPNGTIMVMQASDILSNNTLKTDKPGTYCVAVFADDEAGNSVQDTVVFSVE